MSRNGAEHVQTQPQLLTSDCPTLLKSLLECVVALKEKGKTAKKKDRQKHQHLEPN